jgi:hypothetical protein
MNLKHHMKRLVVVLISYASPVLLFLPIYTGLTGGAAEQEQKLSRFSKRLCSVLRLISANHADVPASVVILRGKFCLVVFKRSAKLAALLITNSTLTQNDIHSIKELNSEKT